MSTTERSAELDWPAALSYLVALIDRPLELTVGGPSGILVDGVGVLQEVRDGHPGEDETMLVAGFRTEAQEFRFYIARPKIERVELDGSTGACRSS